MGVEVVVVDETTIEVQNLVDPSIEIVDPATSIDVTVAPVADTVIEVSGVLNVEVITVGSPVIEIIDPASPLTVEVITEGGGSSEDEAMYTRLVDFIDDNTFYVGQAAPGSLTSSPVWRIKRVTLGLDGDVTELWAGGSASFDKIWDNRTLLSYS